MTVRLAGVEGGDPVDDPPTPARCAPLRCAALRCTALRCFAALRCLGDSDPWSPPKSSELAHVLILFVWQVGTMRNSVPMRQTASATSDKRREPTDWHDGELRFGSVRFGSVRFGSGQRRDPFFVDNPVPEIRNGSWPRETKGPGGIVFFERGKKNQGKSIDWHGDSVFEGSDLVSNPACVPAPDPSVFFSCFVLGVFFAFSFFGWFSIGFLVFCFWNGGKRERREGERDESRGGWGEGSRRWGVQGGGGEGRGWRLARWWPRVVS